MASCFWKSKFRKDAIFAARSFHDSVFDTRNVFAGPVNFRLG